MRCFVSCGDAKGGVGSVSITMTAAGHAGGRWLLASGLVRRPPASLCRPDSPLTDFFEGSALELPGATQSLATDVSGPVICEDS